MLRVLLVDDESIIREGLKEAVPWEHLGFSIIGEAENGDTAIKKIETLKPHVVITDIKMPYSDGINLQQYISNMGKDIYTIVISGYDDFNYAKEMLNLGAFAYLMKPIEEEELGCVLCKIKHDFELQCQNTFQLGKIDKYVHKNNDWVIEYNIKKFLTGHCDVNTLRDRLNKVDLIESDMFFCILQIELHSKLEKKFFNAKSEFMELIAKKILKQMFVLQHNNGLNQYVCAWDKNINTLREKIENLITDMQKNWGYPHSIIFSYSIINKGIESAKKTYLHLVKQNKRKNKYMEITSADIKVQELPKKLTDIDHEILELVDLISFDNKETIDSSVDKIFNIIKNRRTQSYDFIQFLVMAIFLKLIAIIQKSGFEINEVLEESTINIIKSVMQYKTIDEQFFCLKQILYNIRGTLDWLQENKLVDIMIKAKDFIIENYNNEELSLSTTAHYVNMSESYFSTLFKREEGETFKEFLTKIRLEKAKMLLITSNYRSYEIAYKVGYRNPTYFSTLFTKKFGISPMNYRKMNLK